LSSQLQATVTAHEDKLLACIHCGLCLEACPTYVETGDENDGPRGRIYLMRAVAESRLSASSPTFERHINRCLGCRACEPVCPAGVEYGQLLEGARATLQANDNKASWTSRTLHFVLRHIWLKPARLRLLFTFGRLMRDSRLARLLLSTRIPRLISKEAEFGLMLLESSRPMSEPPAVAGGYTQGLSDSHINPPATAGASDTRNPVQIFKGCVTEGLFKRVNDATKLVLDINGYSTSTPNNQVCCGALHAHAGDLEGARQLAKQNIEAFTNENAAPIITNAGGCGAMLLSYSHLFAGDADWSERAHAFSNRVRDISQQLQGKEIKTGAEIGPAQVTYDASCHLINGQHAGDAPLRLLQAIPNLRFVPLIGSDRCCGGRGVDRHRNRL